MVIAELLKYWRAERNFTFHQLSELSDVDGGYLSKLHRSKLRGINSGTIVMGAAAPKPLLAHSSRQQAVGCSGNTNKNPTSNSKVSSL